MFRYRNMCRYNSGFFFKHPLLQKYRWYWRIECVSSFIVLRLFHLTLHPNRPDVHFHCDVTYDPFLYMEEHDKTYGESHSLVSLIPGLNVSHWFTGFTITMYEFDKTIMSLWGHVKGAFQGIIPIPVMSAILGLNSD